jgi:diguanylate cyclase (GGDEF)-like protein
MISIALGAAWFVLVLFVVSLGRAAAHGDARILLGEEQEETLVVDPGPPVPRWESFIGSVDSEVLRAHRYERPLSVAVIEIHDESEMALLEIARRLDVVARHSDVFGRVGDHQLGVLMPEAGQAEAMRAAVRLLAVTDEPVDGRAVRASIGVAGLEPGDTASTLLRRADGALFHVKQSGHGAVGGPLAAETDLRR